MVTPFYISFVLGIREREIRDGLKCMCAVVIIILDRVPTCVGAALSQQVSLSSGGNLLPIQLAFSSGCKYQPPTSMGTSLICTSQNQNA